MNPQLLQMLLPMLLGGMGGGAGGMPGAGLPTMPGGGGGLNMLQPGLPTLGGGMPGMPAGPMAAPVAAAPAPRTIQPVMQPATAAPVRKDPGANTPISAVGSRAASTNVKAPVPSGAPSPLGGVDLASLFGPASGMGGFGL